MPSKKKKYSSRFPPARIKKIMQTDEDVGKVAAPVPVIISRTLELFIESLIIKASEATRAKNAKTLSTSHIKQIILAEKKFDFLKDLVSTVPDIQQTEEEGDAGLNNAGPSASRPPGRPPGRPRKRKEEGATPKRQRKKKVSSDSDSHTEEAESEVEGNHEGSEEDNVEEERPNLRTCEATAATNVSDEAGPSSSRCSTSQTPHADIRAPLTAFPLAPPHIGPHHPAAGQMYPHRSLLHPHNSSAAYPNHLTPMPLPPGSYPLPVWPAPNPTTPFHGMVPQQHTANIDDDYDS